MYWATSFWEREHWSKRAWMYLERLWCWLVPAEPTGAWPDPALRAVRPLGSAVRARPFACGRSLAGVAGRFIGALFDIFASHSSLQVSASADPRGPRRPAHAAQAGAALGQAA